jgi:hypothetical protein
MAAAEEACCGALRLAHQHRQARAYRSPGRGAISDYAVCGASQSLLGVARGERVTAPRDGPADKDAYGGVGKVNRGGRAG